MDYPARRRQQLVPSFAGQGPDALLISNPINVTYLTGFSGDSSCLVLCLPSERAVLVSDARYTEQIADECPGLEVYIRPPDKPLAKAIAEVLTKLGLHSVGFESNHLTVAEYDLLRELAKPLEWKPEKDRVEGLRAIKDESEVAAIREAIAVAERAFTAFCAFLRPTDREKDLYDAMEAFVRKCGGWGTSFPPIIAVGERAALPHAPPSERAIGNAELLLVDWGASGRFYKCDLTRVLPIRRISPKLEEVYQVVFRAQQRAIQVIRPGVKGCDVDAVARSAIAEAGFGDYFGHGLGHGIGLQIHEAPSMRPNVETVLQPGMVVTVEPGIYLPGWGGVRLEDDVLITPEGCELLTHVTQDLASLVIPC